MNDRISDDSHYGFVEALDQMPTGSPGYDDLDSQGIYSPSEIRFLTDTEPTDEDGSREAALALEEQAAYEAAVKQYWAKVEDYADKRGVSYSDAQEYIGPPPKDPTTRPLGRAAVLGANPDTDLHSA